MKTLVRLIGSLVIFPGIALLMLAITSRTLRFFFKSMTENPFDVGLLFVVSLVVGVVVGWQVSRAFVEHFSAD